MMSPGSKGWEEKEANLDGRRGPCNVHFTSTLLRALAVVLLFFFFFFFFFWYIVQMSRLASQSMVP